MKHISVILLDIIDQQLLFQSQLFGISEQLMDLSDSTNINTIASLPMLEADLCALNSLHGRINQSVLAVNGTSPPRAIAN